MVTIHKQKSLSKMVFAITANLLRIRKKPVVLKGNDLKIIFLL